MSSLFAILNVGANGLLANSYGTNVAAHNSSNVGTPGFTRRGATLEPIENPQGGGGARAGGSRRIMDSFVEARLLGARASAGEASARSSSLAILDQVLSEGVGSLGNTLDEFQNAIGDLATHPSEYAAREMVLSRGQSLINAFHMAADDLATARADANDHISLETAKVNDMLHKIAGLNVAITKAEVSGQEASDLRDQRDEIVRQLSDSLPVSTLEKPNGQVSVLLNGTSVLVTDDGRVHDLVASPDGPEGDVLVYVNGTARDNVTAKIMTGKMAGYIQARDGAITDAQSRLDELAYRLAYNYNQAHAAGAGLPPENASGVPFFANLASRAHAASLIELSEDIDGNPERIAAATDPDSPGDNRNALLMQQIASSALVDPDDSLVTDGVPTASGRLAELISFGGAAVGRAQDDEEHTAQAADQMNALRDQVSGVNIDEEMINLDKFQRAYQASLKVIQVADEMMSDLINLKR